MKFTVDFAELTRERAMTAQQARQLKIVAWKIVRAHSFKAEANVKRRMPVKTGRARASWGHSAPPAAPNEGIWEEDEAGLSITQGSRVEYIEQLNEGWSQQAPAGFIDAVQAAEQAALEEDLADQVEAMFG